MWPWGPPGQPGLFSSSTSWPVSMSSFTASRKSITVREDDSGLSFVWFYVSLGWFKVAGMGQMSQYNGCGVVGMLAATVKASHVTWLVLLSSKRKVLKRRVKSFPSKVVFKKVRKRDWGHGIIGLASACGAPCHVVPIHVPTAPVLI